MVNVIIDTKDITQNHVLQFMNVFVAILVDTKSLQFSLCQKQLCPKV